MGSELEVNKAYYKVGEQFGWDICGVMAHDDLQSARSVAESGLRPGRCHWLPTPSRA